jgi:hypothetical protein
MPSVYLLNRRTVITFLDRLEESRHLSPLEAGLRSLAKHHLLETEGKKSKTALWVMRTPAIFTSAPWGDSRKID